MAETLIKLIDWARDRVRSKVEESAPGATYWKAALDALDACREKSETIEAIGEDRFKELLQRISVIDDGQDTMDAYIEVIHEMTAQEIIAEVGASADRVEADRIKREQRKRDLLELLVSLGQIGASLVLTFIL